MFGDRAVPHGRRKENAIRLCGRGLPWVDELVFKGQIRFHFDEGDHE
jgi:hypothetical protein